MKRLMVWRKSPWCLAALLVVIGLSAFPARTSFGNLKILATLADQCTIAGCARCTGTLTELRSYPDLVLYLLQPATCASRSASLDEAYARLKANGGYSRMLDWIEATLDWKEGRYTQSCAGYRELVALPAVQHFAEAAYAAQDWVGLSQALSCIRESPEELASGLSPYALAMLHYRLAQHDAAAGDLSPAVQSYQQAILLYPVVWSAPVTELAGLWVEMGGIDRAVDILLTSLRRTEDPKARFDLYRQLALTWDAQGAAEASYCAAAEALILSGPLGENLAPESWREDLARRMVHLRSGGAIDGSGCPSFWQGVLP